MIAVIQSSFPVRLMLTIVAIVCMYYLLPDWIKEGAADNSFLSLKSIVAFHVFLIMMLSTICLMKGANNRLIAAGYFFVVMYELLGYNFALNSLWGISPYITMWISTISALFTYVVIKHFDAVRLVFYSNLMRIPKLQHWALNRISEVRITRFKLQILSVVRYTVIIELVLAVYFLSYALLMGVPWDGSVSQTMQQHNHFNPYPMYLLVLDGLLVYYLFICIKSVLEEWMDGEDMLLAK